MKNLIAIAVLVVLGVIAFVVFREKPSEENKKVVDAIKAIPLDRLDTIRIERFEGTKKDRKKEKYTLSKKGDTWRMSEPVEYPVVESTVESMTKALSELRAIDIISEKAANHTKFEVDKDKGVIVEALAGKEVLGHFIIGNASPSYLVLIADGADTCGNETGHFPTSEVGANAAQLGTRARTLRDEHEIYTVAIGVGDQVAADQLDAITSNGGTDFTSYFSATTDTGLTAALSEIAQYADQCEYGITATAPPQIGYMIKWKEVKLYLNGERIERDPLCAIGTGWDWINPGDYTSITLCDALCADAPLDAPRDLTMTFDCVPQPLGLLRPGRYGSSC